MGLQILFFSMYGRFILLDLKVGFESLHGWGLSPACFSWVQFFIEVLFVRVQFFLGSLWVSCKVVQSEQNSFQDVFSSQLKFGSVLMLGLVQFSCQVWFSSHVRFGSVLILGLVQFSMLGLVQILCQVWFSSYVRFGSVLMLGLVQFSCQVCFSSHVRVGSVLHVKGGVLQG